MPRSTDTPQSPHPSPPPVGLPKLQGAPPQDFVLGLLALLGSLQASSLQLGNEKIGVGDPKETDLGDENATFLRNKDFGGQDF